ncbi:hypothetical protein NMG60_11031963, partial [Bertholletia excelsa]
MGFSSLLLLVFLVLFNGCLAQWGQPQREQWQGVRAQQRHRLRPKTDCSIQSLDALQPTRRIEAEAGVTEIWDPTHKQFQCAGVAAIRHVIQPRGLLLPSYTHASQLYYVVQGRGIQGTVLPGCPETYESGLTFKAEHDTKRRQDRHQKLREIRQGDIFALPAGLVHWAHNSGDLPLILVSIIDLGDDENHLDFYYRKFFLAGNPESRQQESRREREGQQAGRHAGNIFSGLDEQILADALNVDPETARKLQGQDDERGNIVRVERELELVSPRSREEEEERERGRDVNRFGQNMCAMRLREVLGDPGRADVYNPDGGRISTLNGRNLPILNYMQLSAERGVLYKNAILAPQWNVNAHSIVYFLRGSGRVQVVGYTGKSVFDGQVREGQILVIPQNFALIKKASNQGLEWVAFKTNNDAVTTSVVGKVSAIRSFPVEILVNSFGISSEEARRLKYNREEVAMFSPGRRS